MKTSILILSFFVCSLVVSAQKMPPAAVSKAFAEKFKSAEKVKWGMEDAKEWEAEFEMNGKETSASFDLSGKWLETETEIQKSELPGEIKAMLDKEYPGAKIGECSLLDSPDFPGYEYEISLESKGHVYELKTTKDGKVGITIMR